VQDWSADWAYVIWSVLSASIGVIALAGGLFGWLLALASVWHRTVLIAAALCLIKPGLYTDVVGLALLAVVLSSQFVGRRRSAESGVRPA